MNRLEQQYELFKMSLDEDIKSLFTHFTKLTNKLFLHGKAYSEEEKVREILKSIPKTWSNICTTIDEAHDLTVMINEVLQGKLLTHEIAMKDKKSEDECKEKKSIAIKVIQDSESDNED